MANKIIYALSASLLLLLGGFGTAQALTYPGAMPPGVVTPSANSGMNTQIFYPYPSGALVNDSGTIYFISGSTKVPFTNLQAFIGLGYSMKNVINGDLTNYNPPQSYTINTANAEHPWGSWLIYKGTVYYSTQAGLIGVPDAQTFQSNGGDWTLIVPANQYDVAALNAAPDLPLLAVNDPRVITVPNYQFSGGGTITPTPTPTPMPTPIPPPLIIPTPTMPTPDSSGTALSIVTTTLPNGTVGQAYTGVVGVAYNGANTLNISVTGLPPGLLAPTSATDVGALGAWGMQFSGMPTASGTFPVVVAINDGAGASASYDYSLTVNPASSSSDSPQTTPTTPVISGPVTTKAGVSNNYTFNSTDQNSGGYNGGLLSYSVDWGDNTSGVFVTGQPSGASIMNSHVFASDGNYIISVTVTPAEGAAVQGTLYVAVSN